MPNEYKLPAKRPFPQIEPESSYWFRCPVLSIISFEDLKKPIQESKSIDDLVEPYETVNKKLLADIIKLKNLYNNRKTDFDATALTKISIFLKDKPYIMNPPAGSVVSTTANGLPRSPLIKNGLELATLFENETPGLWHRHVLNILLDPSIDGGLGQKLSPPLQALVWAALDVAIASALMAAWHYKWLATGKNAVARRQRPYEFDDTLKVLYDFEVRRSGSNNTGDIIRDEDSPKPAPQPTPGTPRHPAYPSGHSTYSAAASTVLECFFRKQKDINGKSLKGEFNKLAKNIGIARLWGGVHWSDDDTAGRIIGNAVGNLVIEQLDQTGIYQLLDGEFKLEEVERNILDEEAKTFDENCENEKTGSFCDGLPREDNVFQNLQG